MRITLSDNERILVVAPHPDDESIGCGGLLNLYRGHCDVLLVTDGISDVSKEKELSAKRQKEFVEAMKVCGVDNRFLLHIPQLQILNHFNRFLSIDYSIYKYIFVPNRYEYHRDHVDTYKSVKKAIKQLRIKTDLVEYEVWTTIRFPNFYLDISPVLDKKIEAINQHRSQTANLDYVKFITGLNAYRGISKQMKYAESFYCASEKRRENIRHLKRRIKKI